jgi:ammonium transporter Rh
LTDRSIAQQDVCGIHNLHGMPSIIAALVSIFAATGMSQNEPGYFLPRGTNQPAIQLAATGITLGIAIAGGFITGCILWLLTFITPIRRPNFFHDKGFWNLPSDYDEVINAVDDGIKSDEELEVIA